MTQAFFIEHCNANDIGTVVHEDFRTREEVYTRMSKLRTPENEYKLYILRWQVGDQHSDQEHFPESNR